MNVAFERSECKDEWLTPPRIIKALGEFDLDPCSPITRPWDTAKKHYSRLDDGLMQPWDGRVWMNPPYGTQTGRWMRRLADHGNGIALTFARTETRMFFESVWGVADAIFFFKGRLKFMSVEGKESGTAGAPSALIAYGEWNAGALKDCGLPGHFVNLKT